MSWPRGGPGRPAGSILTPQDRAGLIALFREHGAIHIHRQPLKYSERWVLTVTNTKLCGTERCAWIKLR